MRALLAAACLLLAVPALPGAAAAPADCADDGCEALAEECYGVTLGREGFTGTCVTPECGYLYVRDRYVGEYGPCVSTQAA